MNKKAVYILYIYITYICNNNIVNVTYFLTVNLFICNKSDVVINV